MRIKYDIAGQKFSKLLAIEPEIKDGKTMWKCKCDCGNITYAYSYDMIKGKKMSCGCLRKELNLTLPVTHGMSGTRIYNTYNDMIKRCYSSKQAEYENYGGRGIKVCDSWKNSFESFYAWAMGNGYTNEMTIDRIDVNGNYEPSNCRFITKKQQSLNKTNSHYLTYKGETRTVKEWSDITGINYGTLESRINCSHWSIEDALTKPVKVIKRKKIGRR